MLPLRLLSGAPVSALRVRRRVVDSDASVAQRTHRSTKRNNFNSTRWPKTMLFFVVVADFVVCGLTNNYVGQVCLSKGVLRELASFHYANFILVAISIFTMRFGFLSLFIEINCNEKQPLAALPRHVSMRCAVYACLHKMRDQYGQSRSIIAHYRHRLRSLPHGEDPLSCGRPRLVRIITRSLARCARVFHA